MALIENEINELENYIVNRVIHIKYTINGIVNINNLNENKKIEVLCCMINNYIKNILLKYHNTNIKIIDRTKSFINRISYKYNISEYKVLNYNSDYWYNSNFANKIICTIQKSLYERFDNDYELSKIQKCDLIWHFYELIVIKKCNRHIINDYNHTFIDYLNLLNITNDNYKYVSLLKIIIKYGHNLVNKQQQLIRKWLNKRKLASDKINYWVCTYITCNIDCSIGRKRLLNVSDSFYKKYKI